MGRSDCEDDGLQAEMDGLRADVLQFVSSDIVKEIEEGLGLPKGFAAALVDDPSDWSFIVKTAVVVEAALGQTIASHFDSPEMQAHLARLSMEGRAGKVQLAKDLGVLDVACQARIRALTTIRNAFAHDIKVIQTSLAAYFNSLNRDDAARLLGALIAKTGDAVKPAELGEGAHILDAAARLLVWSSASKTLFDLAQRYRHNKNARRWESSRALLGDAFVARLQGREAEAREKMQEARGTLGALQSSVDGRISPRAFAKDPHAGGGDKTK